MGITDEINKELDIISKKSEFGEMSLIPIRDFRIIMNRVNAAETTDRDSHSHECAVCNGPNKDYILCMYHGDGANIHMKPIEKWFMRRLETMVCRILSREGKAPTADNITRFIKDVLDELAEERRDDYYMGS